MSRKGKMIELISSDGASIGCYQVMAEGSRKGGVVLLHEVYGVTDHIRDVCDDYASHGYDVLAPQLYDRQEKNFFAPYEKAAYEKAGSFVIGVPLDNPLRDTQMCIDALRAQGCKRVGAVGYCYGGTVAWYAAIHAHDLDAASCYYGSGIKEYLTEQPKIPTICHFGSRDQFIPVEIAHEIEKERPDIKMYIYDARHGFNSDRRVDYDKTSADLALKRTLDLFQGA